MGRVRTKYIKRAAKEVYEKFSDKFSKNFENNKSALNIIVEVQSKKIRNKLAGYLTSLKKRETTTKTGGG